MCSTWHFDLGGLGSPNPSLARVSRLDVALRSAQLQLGGFMSPYRAVARIVLSRIPARAFPRTHAAVSHPCGRDRNAGPFLSILGVTTISAGYDGICRSLP